MKHILLVGLILTSFLSAVDAQKVKYKDLFILLNAENFKDADPFLRKFIIANPDHPNANYYMGKMLHTYMSEADLIKDSLRIIEMADSAIIYVNKSLQLCTEKYVEKQHDDDYYAGHRRRNMRTGKFEVKLSDVQLQMENLKEAIIKFKQDDENLIAHFRAAERFNMEVFNLYSSLVNGSETLNILYFTAGAEQLEVLRDIAKNYDSTIYHFNTYRVLKKDISKNRSVQKLEEMIIKDYPLNLTTNTDFTAENVMIWNLKAWSRTTLDKIGKEIFPLKVRMVEYDKELDDVHDRIVKDSLDGRSEIFALATKNVGRDLRDYDNSSLPAAIYNYRIAEINYHSTTNVWHLQVKDTLNIDVKYNVLADIEKQLSAISRLVVRLVNANTAKERVFFRDFIAERYEDEIGLNNFVQEQVAFVHEDSVQLLNWLTKTNKLDTRTMWHSDSIPLVVGSQIINLDSINYSTVRVDSLDNRRIGFYSWQANKDSLALAFGVSPSSRVLDTLFTVDLGLAATEQAQITSTYLSDSLNDDKLVWVIPKEQKEDKFPLQIFTTSLSSGLGWKINVDLEFLALSVSTDNENNQIIISGDNEESVLKLDMAGNVQEEDVPEGNEEGNPDEEPGDGGNK